MYERSSKLRRDIVTDCAIAAADSNLFNRAIVLSVLSVRTPRAASPTPPGTTKVAASMNNDFRASLLSAAGAKASRANEIWFV
jgi:hypothetical protein